MFSIKIHLQHKDNKSLLSNNRINKRLDFHTTITTHKMLLIDLREKGKRDKRDLMKRKN